MCPGLPAYTLYPENPHGYGPVASYRIRGKFRGVLIFVYFVGTD